MGNSAAHGLIGTSRGPAMCDFLREMDRGWSHCLKGDQEIATPDWHELATCGLDAFGGFLDGLA